MGHLLARPGTPRHLYGWGEAGDSGILLRGGARLKDNVDEHVGPGIRLASSSTQEIARLVVEPTKAGPTCYLKQMVEGEWFATSPTSMGGPITRRELRFPTWGPRGGEYSICAYDARTSPTFALEGYIQAEFSGVNPMGWAFRPVT